MVGKGTAVCENSRTTEVEAGLLSGVASNVAGFGRFHGRARPDP